MLLEKDRRFLLRSELRAARLRAGLKQSEVAEMLGRPQSFMAKVESGERRVDFVETLSLCKALHLDPHVLVDAVTK